jgi:hypothetical protein
MPEKIKSPTMTRILGEIRFQISGNPPDEFAGKLPKPAQFKSVRTSDLTLNVVPH